MIQVITAHVTIVYYREDKGLYEMNEENFSGVKRQKSNSNRLAMTCNLFTPAQCTIVMQAKIHYHIRSIPGIFYLLTFVVT